MIFLNCNQISKFLTIIIICNTFTLISQTKIYWLDLELGIKRANIDGSEIEDLGNRAGVFDFAIDPFEQKIYEAIPSDNKIQVVDLKNQRVEDLITDDIQIPITIEIDLINKKIYWGDFGLKKIKRANLDGSNIEDIIIESDKFYPTSITISNRLNKIYWTDSRQNRIMRANMDGTEIEKIIEFNVDVVPGHIFIDTIDNKLYWSESVLEKIQKSNFDGSLIEDVKIDGLLKNPDGIFIDYSSNKLFWTERDLGKGKIQSMDLSTNKLQTILSEGISSPAKLIKVNPITTKIESIEEITHKLIYPNPCSNHLTIMEIRQNQNFEIWNTDGKIQIKGSLTSTSNKINVSSLNAGTYILKIKKEKVKILYPTNLLRFDLLVIFSFMPEEK